MNSNTSKSKLLPKAEKLLRNLSLERLRVAFDFLAYLKERESSDATQELLTTPGFEENFMKASGQVDKGDIVGFDKIKRHV